MKKIRFGFSNSLSLSLSCANPFLCAISPISYLLKKLSKLFFPSFLCCLKIFPLRVFARWKIFLLKKHQNFLKHTPLSPWPPPSLLPSPYLNIIPLRFALARLHPHTLPIPNFIFNFDRRSSSTPSSSRCVFRSFLIFVVFSGLFWLKQKLDRNLNFRKFCYLALVNFWKTRK